MTTFKMLPITLTNPTLGSVPEADKNYFVDYEPTSYEHWIFDNGATGLTGRNNGKVLTAQSNAPTYSSSYLSMNSGVGKGLLTDLLESSDAKVTMCAVIREDAGTSHIKCPFGTLDNTSGSGTGGMPFMSGATSSRKLYTTYKGITATADTAAVLAPGTWRFVALALDASGATKRVRTLVGGQTAHESTGASAFAASNRAIVLGNGYYTSGGASNTDFAEFILFNRALSAADMQAIYVRCKARLLAKGITIA